MMKCNRRAAAVGLAGVALAFSCIAAAAEWPAKPVRIIVPFAAGGAADTLGQLYADALSTAFGKQFYVENRLGAGGQDCFCRGHRPRGA